MGNHSLVGLLLIIACGAFFIGGVFVGDGAWQTTGAKKAHSGQIKCALVQNKDKTTRWECLEIPE